MMRAREWCRIAPLLALGLFSVLALPACGGGTGDGAGTDASVPSNPIRGGKIVYGIESDPNGLDPSKNGWDPAALTVANALFDPLVAWDAEGRPQPYLLESYTHNDDYTVWTAKVRPNVKFHDGTPLDAAAIVKHTDAMKSSAITGPAATGVDHAEAVDAQTVKLMLKRSWASFPALLAGQAGHIASPKQLDDPDGSSKPIGTGPFKLKSWEVGKKLTVIRNPDYWRAGLPYLDEVEFLPIGESQKRVEQLQNGTLNVIHNSDVSIGGKLDELARPDGGLPEGGSSPGINVVHDQGITEANFAMMNTAKAPLDDLRVRRALAHGFDIQTAADTNGWPKDRLITDSIFPRGSPWYSATPYPSFDPAKAKQLVDEYEAEKGPISITLGVTSDSVNLAQGQVIADQWSKVGIEVKVEAIEQKELVIRAVVGSYDVLLMRYFAAVDPDANSPFWTSETVRPPGQISLNFTRLKDDEIDRALTDAQASPDMNVRKKAYAKVQERFAELVPYIWTFRTDWAIASSKSVHDVRNKTLPDGRPALPFTAGIHRLTETWVQPN